MGSITISRQSPSLTAAAAMASMSARSVGSVPWPLAKMIESRM